jgi:Outer membrane protein beta-barrel domain
VFIQHLEFKIQNYMKKLLILPLLLLVASVQAQSNTDEKGDTTRITMKNKTIEIIQDSISGKNKIIITPIGKGGETQVIETDENGNVTIKDDENEDEKPSGFQVRALGVDIGSNLFFHDGSLNYPANLEALESKPLNSINVNLHALGFRIGMLKSHVNLCTAIDFDFMQMAFSKNTILFPNQDSLTWAIDSTTSYRKSKLNATYLQFPLMLRFETKPGQNEKCFRFAVGGYYGILINSFTKTKTEGSDRVVEKDDFNLNKIRYGITGRIGYGGLEFFAKYNLTPLFREDQGPEFAALTVGVAINTPW